MDAYQPEVGGYRRILIHQKTRERPGRVAPDRQVLLSLSINALYGASPVEFVDFLDADLATGSMSQRFNNGSIP